jgi:hypothetical protein
MTESDPPKAQSISGQADALSDEELMQLNRKWYAELSQIHAQDQAELEDRYRSHVKWAWWDPDRIGGPDELGLRAALFRRKLGLPP